jgi:hypothetical protein
MGVLICRFMTAGSSSAHLIELIAIDLLSSE